MIRGSSARRDRVAHELPRARANAAAPASSRSRMRVASATASAKRASSSARVELLVPDGVHARRSTPLTVIGRTSSTSGLRDRLAGVVGVDALHEALVDRRRGASRRPRAPRRARARRARSSRSGCRWGARPRRPSGGGRSRRSRGRSGRRRRRAGRRRRCAAASRVRTTSSGPVARAERRRWRRRRRRGSCRGGWRRASPDTVGRSRTLVELSGFCGLTVPMRTSCTPPVCPRRSGARSRRCSCRWRRTSSCSRPEPGWAPRRTSSTSA